MKFTQYYLDCLSHASYLIGDETSGLAVVVDPQRDVEQYLSDARTEGLRIVAVIETHFHADFLSGHLELAEATGAEIIYGEAAEAAFAFRGVADGERLPLGEVVLEFRSTPGHTPESISIVVWEHADDVDPFGVLTGDTLFIGDVGRPDLLASKGVTADELARMLYRSLRDRILTLPDSTRVYPAHGAGSACGKNLSTETTSTIGEQRSTNYALLPMSEEAFVAAVTEGQTRAPDYFVYDAGLNKSDRALLDDTPPNPLTLDEVLAAQATGAVVLDTREAAAFGAGHLRGSLNVGLDGRYAEYAGSVISPAQSIVLLTDPGEEHEAKVRLARIGFDRVAGVLADGVAALADRPEVVERSSRLTVEQFDARTSESSAVQVVDIRTGSEVAVGTIPGARPIPITALGEAIDELDLRAPIVVFCAGGYRSSIAASLLRARGATDVSDILGGYTAWLATHAGTSV